ncbi:hypothetical protein C2R22_19620 [Salinigranum rubrum]|uniref:Uncharacterized protein n=1 Tax=Salinigranum rubrum TaxID=755307 RepID=A0A2I8VNS6_9EURY|nr:hypothetical protein [Salinigranum rubrum]AUV83578.1 hypothetical protein C2R22_19620 [Salinigranum rubrum]
MAAFAESYGRTVTAPADSNSAVVDERGVDVSGALARKRESGDLGDDTEAALYAGDDCLVETTPTTLDDAEPSFSHVVTALDGGRHVVLGNEGPSHSGVGN